MQESDPTIDLRTRRALLRAGATGAVAALAGCAGLGDGGDSGPGGDGTPTDDGGTTPGSTTPGGELVDDWQYEPPSKGGSGGGGNASATYAQAAPASGSAEDVGFAAGGAKDVNAFRRNVEEGYLPLPSSLSYEGLFYDYYFDTGGAGECSDLFCPRYSPGVTDDPLSGETERYLTVGLDSGLDAAEFERKKLNLVVVLDVSGSMSASFDEYYYDRYGNKQEIETSEKPKMEVAKEAVADMTTHLTADDRFGMVTFNNSSQVAKPLRRVGETDMDAIRGHIREDLVAGGGTNMAAGIGRASEMLSEYGENVSEYETRIVFLTDAMPNMGTTSEDGLRSMLSDDAADNVHTTFVGVGVDFNTEVIDAITSIRGANYYSVHSADEFERRLNEEFEYMVTPLVFDLEVELDGEGYELREVYGTSAAEESTGRVLYANTLFPSPATEGETRGGVILAQVAPTTSDPGSLELTASWADRQGRTDATSTTVKFPDASGTFANSGVRKAVLLSRYADLLKNWMVDTRERDGEPTSEGIRVPEDDHLGKWEQQSEDLRVSGEYRQRIAAFAEHFESEMNAIGDEDLQQELDVLEKLADYGAEGRVTGLDLPAD
ncbi:hypothetical protein BRD00_14710 [Halobacteriales archaeon QS_8_69_26]|nr:MAG: hypothetical protein BRD00_14710 [Halobacteriales archaeon QS_8_69_26]